MEKIEETKLNNFSAQYRSILSNIQIANSELEKALEQKNTLEAEITSLSEKREELLSIVNELFKQRDDTNRELDNKIRTVRAREEKIGAYEIAIREQLDRQIEEVKKEVSKTDQYLASKREALSILEDEEASLLTTVGLLQKQVEDYSKQISGLSKEKTDLHRSLDELHADYSNKESEYKKKIKRLEEELHEAKRKKEAEERKIIEADKYIKEKEKEFARRERDILTVTRRLRTLYQEVKPGIALKI